MIEVQCNCSDIVLIGYAVLPWGGAIVMNCSVARLLWEVIWQTPVSQVALNMLGVGDWPGLA